MPLKCVGNQRLETVSNSLLNGASHASASIWVRINSGNDVIAMGGVEVFGDGTDRFSVTLLGTTSLRLQWSSQNGQAGEVSACDLTLKPGKSHHLAATWQPGSQRFYLDGVQVSSDARTGVLGMPGSIASGRFQVGSDQPGTDVVIDRPTIWIGHVLDDSEIVALRDGSTSAASIAPASIALSWSLIGPDAQSATPGDVGLSDTSPSGLSLSTIVGAAPTYQADALTYDPTPTVTAAVAPSGESVILVATDGYGNPAPITGIAPPNGVVSFRMMSVPAGPFTISVGGHDTAPIPFTIVDPVVFLALDVATVAGHTYDLAVTYVPNPYAGPNLLFEVLDGATILASTPLPGATLTGFTDPGVVGGANDLPVVWASVASAIVAGSTSLRVRFTATRGGYGFTNLDAVRVHDTTAETTSYIDDVEATSFPAGHIGRDINSLAYDQTLSFLGNSTGVGPIVTINGGAAALQSALEALPNIGPGAVQVVGFTDNTQPDNGSDKYQISFVSPDAAPLVTCPDPAVALAVLAPGGYGPTIHLNGSPILLYPLLYEQNDHAAFALGLLPQSGPAKSTYAAGNAPFFGQADRQFTMNSYSGQVFAAYVNSTNFGFLVTLLQPATYQLAITWPTVLPSAFGQPFTPCTATHVTVQDARNNVLATVTIDQTQAPADYTDGGYGWKVVGSFTLTAPTNTLKFTMTGAGIAFIPNNGLQAAAVLDAIQITRTSPDTSISITPQDIVTLDVPANSITTTIGVVPAFNGLAVAPPSPTSILPPFVAAPKTMRVGYNVMPIPSYGNFPTHANLARMLTFTDGFVTANADRYPTRLPAATFELDIVGRPGIAFGDPGIGQSTISPGRYTVRWDGDGDSQLIASSGTTVTEVSTTLSVGVGNVRLYDVRFDPTVIACPQLRLRLVSTTPDPADSTGTIHLINLANLEIHEPDPADPTGNTAWANPPKFHPKFIAKLANIQSIRYLDVIGVNFNSCGTFAHFKPTTHLDRCNPAFAHVTQRIATIQAPPNGSVLPSRSYTVYVQVTTTAPHGLFSGCQVSFSGLPGIATFATGTVDLGQSEIMLVLSVIDATNVIVAVQCYGNPASGSAMTNTLTGGTLETPSLGSLWPLEDIADLIVAAGAKELWFNSPLTLDTTPGGATDQVATYLDARLPAGTIVHDERGNECWNTNFYTNIHCILQNTLATGVNGAYQPYYVEVSRAGHDRFQAVFTAARRTPAVVRTFGTWAVSTTTTLEVMTAAIAASIPIDEFCVGAYYGNRTVLGGATASQFPAIDLMTNPQLCDYLEANTVYGHYAQVYVTDHLDALSAAGFTPPLWAAYEGGMDSVVPNNPNGDGPGIHVRLNAVKRNPRAFGVTLFHAQQFQDAGMDVLNYYNVGGLTSGSNWDTWEAADQQPGTGDPAIDVVNVLNPQAKGVAKSEIGGAWQQWASLVSATVDTTGTDESQSVSNGRLTTHGLPQGTMRLFVSP